MKPNNVLYFSIKENHFLSHSLIKLLRTLAAYKRSDDPNIDLQDAITDATNLLENNFETS